MKERVMQLIRAAGVLREGHFRLASGRHTGMSIQCMRLFEDARATAEVCAYNLGRISCGQVDVIIGPAMGGVIPAYETARLLGKRNIFCERQNGRLTLRRGFRIDPGERVLIAEDVITTGGSLRETVRLIEENGGVAVGAVAIADLSGGRAAERVQIPVVAAVELSMDTYAPEDCPMCAAGVPLEKTAERSI